MTFSALDSALTGPLFATERMRAIFSDEARVAAMLRAEAALARAEARFGLAPEALAAAIEAIEPGSLDLRQLGVDTALAGVPTIPFVKAVQKRLPPELESAFHKGSTTQDIVDTALALQMRDALEALRRDLAPTLAGLSALARRHRTTLCVGRTYGQHAAPVSFGFKAAGWLAGLADVGGRLPDIRTRTLLASLSGPVGTLAGLREHGPAVQDAFAAELSLGAPPLAWHTRRSAVVEVGIWLAMLIGALGKMATDVASLASTEIGEVAEPYTPGRGGSSAMPHKRNPVSSTVMLAAAGAAPGLASTLLTAMTGAHERPAGAWHAEWHALPQLFGLASGALAEARRLAEGLEIDADRMRRNVDLTQGLLFADAAASALTPALGRAAAHHLVEEAAGAVRTSGRSLRDVIDSLPDLPASFDRAALARAFDPAPSINAAARFVDRAVAAAQPVQDALAS
ncbi:3-carboxy-cis,cis-muconate cycloisomerase [Alsobacter metallidurans]|uniref:3-carboxy-cis,cis-muconate cycloisomerase n=1 Tax=Alsobacter metallidurans TaxID=340221 RepID=A0A917I2Q9_9HYPH|nr:adenylosuccinate lyase family protein [Alsobacter metallidurans]GGH06402.1 3-carboxy-cis,cis-muconate cycloisomerase [Alsobacter metallidurans]